MFGIYVACILLYYNRVERWQDVLWMTHMCHILHCEWLKLFVLGVNYMKRAADTAHPFMAFEKTFIGINVKFIELDMNKGGALTMPAERGFLVPKSCKLPYELCPLIKGNHN